MWLMSDEDIVKEFLIESHENLDRLDQDLIALEKDPGNRETLASVFRTIHTIKGTSGFLAFNQLEALTHAGESLLAKLRDGLLALTPEITTALLAMVDAVRQMLASIEASGSEGERNNQELIATLAGLLRTGAEQNPAPAAKKSEPDRAVAPKAVPKVVQKTEGQGVDAPITDAPISDIAAGSASAVASDVDISQVDKSAEPGKPELPAVDHIAVANVAVAKQVPKPQDTAAVSHPQPPVQGHSASDSTIRIDVGQLDRLMNRVGELVLLRNQIVQYTNSIDDSELLGTSQRLNLLTTELQEGVMKTRMQPIGNIWSKFPRTVRDVAMGCGKQARLEMEGKETELDKTIIEAIKDPLTHLVRNAVDHGIELPAVRRAAGKDPEGRLLLRAFHEGGQVNIEISDDGAGLDYEKIRNKAIQKGLISADQAARMSERETANLIFLPGLSTAAKVTNVSGRGVGMDVVKTNIEKIGGTVDVQSKPGQGSTVRMKIPLTLAIIPALIVTTGGDRYAIPQVSLLELVHLEGEQVRQGIELVNDAPVYRLRGRLLPLVYLNRELKVDAQAQETSSSQAASGAKQEALDFAQARQKHQQWTGRLREVLDGKATMTVEQAGSPTGCALGKWLYSAGLTEYGDIAEMGVLEATHKQFHELVRGIVALHGDGNGEGAEREFRNVEPFSRKIIELLALVEKKVLDSQTVNIVVLRADDHRFGLVVDEINDTEEIVVKPLGKQLKIINTYAGATIMGDGKVALILDVLGLAQRANVVGEVRERAVTQTKDRQHPLEAADGNPCNAVLLFQFGENERMAIDLALVARLEEFPRHAIEIAADHEVVQYRGQIMPLIRVSEMIPSAHAKAVENAGQSLQVVVYADRGRSVGLVVDRILDIVEESFVVRRQTGRPGVLGSAVIQKRVTDILDVPGLIAAAEGGQLLSGMQA
jgi:chemotaxis protein histidine kinase CheA